MQSDAPQFSTPQRDSVSTLHVDIEGGWGGSSRSLYELISRLDRRRIAPLVVHRREGPLQDWYRAIGVETVHVPSIGSFVPRETKAFKNLAARLPELARTPIAGKAIANIALAHKSQVIHLNYEGLFPLAAYLRRQLGLPMIVHSRAVVGDNVFGRLLYRTLDRTTDRILFISPEEESRHARMTHQAAGAARNGEVMWNIARRPMQRVSVSEPPEIVFFGSINESKGVLRIPRIARILLDMGCRAAFHVFGAVQESQSAQKLAELCKDLGVADRVALHPHTDEVAVILSRAAVLIRPSLMEDPWGRDVIEATSAGVPVVATGTNQSVIGDGINGVLVHPYSDAAFAEALRKLLTDDATWTRMSAAGQKLGEQKFSGARQAARFTEIVNSLAIGQRP